MADWFLVVFLGARMVVGPLTEGDCQIMKRTVFDGTGAICIDRRMIDVKRKA